MDEVDDLHDVNLIMGSLRPYAFPLFQYEGKYCLQNEMGDVKICARMSRDPPPPFRDDYMGACPGDGGTFIYRLIADKTMIFTSNSIEDK